jgi:aminocarboxymuconate-semialdehyde decarboxylase
MNENNLALQIHPYEMENIIDLDDDLWNPWIYGMPFLTGLAHQAITANDYHNIYPNIRFNFAHAGKLSSISYGRHHQGFVGRPDLYK